MRILSLLVLGLSGGCCALTNAQNVSPVPVADAEVRDASSVKMRSIQLDRVVREASKPVLGESNEAATIRFARIKEDFESLQNRQTDIIKAYTTGKQINYQKIGAAAADLNRNAIRLAGNLFSRKTIEEKSKPEKKRASVRDLIIELDRAIGAFVTAPIFRDNKVLPADKVENSRRQLERIIQLSAILSLAAKTPE